MVARRRRRRREPNSRDTNLKRAGRGGRRRRRGGILFHSVLATQPNTEEEGRKEKIGGSSGNRPWKVLLNIVPAKKGGKQKKTLANPLQDSTPHFEKRRRGMGVMRWAQSNFKERKRGVGKRRRTKVFFFSLSSFFYFLSSLISYEEGELGEGGGLFLLTLLCGDMSGPDWRNVV